MPTECVEINSISTSIKQPITVWRRDSNNATNARRNTASGVRCCKLVYNNNQQQKRDDK